MLIYKTYKGNLFKEDDEVSIEIHAPRKVEVVNQKYENDVMVYIILRSLAVVREFGEEIPKRKLIIQGNENNYCVVDAGVKHSIDMGRGAIIIAYKLKRNE